MTISRRAASMRLLAASLGVVYLAKNERAFAETYLYDAHGRVVRTTYPDGSVTAYTYDNAGNRLIVGRAAPGPFNQTIALAGAGPINLRAVADAAAYDGLRNATIVFEVNSGVTIVGAAGASSFSSAGPGGNAIDTGVWPTSSYSISLTVRVKNGGKVRGGGGGGGPGASNYGAPTPPGGAGGDAVFCQAGAAIIVDAGGEIIAGGGGGGGGGGWHVYAGGDDVNTPGGRGGGGYPNGLGANPGTPSGGGGGSAGSSASMFPSRVTGAGGAGGGQASAGTIGANPTGPVSDGYAWITRGNGGAAGAAVRKNGHTVSITNNGTITGAVS